MILAVFLLAFLGPLFVVLLAKLVSDDDLPNRGSKYFPSEANHRSQRRHPEPKISVRLDLKADVSVAKPQQFDVV